MTQSKINKLINIILICCAASANAGFDAGFCASPSTKQNVSIDAYSGRWYEIWRDATIPFELGASCTTATYTKLTNTTIKVENRCYYWPLSFLAFNIEGAAKCNANAQCYVSFTSPPFFDRDPNYLVLDTDYTSYSIVYSCNNFLNGLMKYENVWFLSRTPLVSTDLLNKVTNIITKKIPRYN